MQSVSCLALFGGDVVDVWERGVDLQGPVLARHDGLCLKTSHPVVTSDITTELGSYAGSQMLGSSMQKNERADHKSNKDNVCRTKQPFQCGTVTVLKHIINTIQTILDVLKTDVETGLNIIY